MTSSRDKKPKPIPGLTQEVVENLLRQGMPKVDIGRMFSCSETTITRFIRLFGLEEIAKTYKKPIAPPAHIAYEKKVVYELFNQGKSDDEIAMAIGCNTSRVTKIRLKLGLTRSLVIDVEGNRRRRQEADQARKAALTRVLAVELHEEKERRLGRRLPFNPQVNVDTWVPSACSIASFDNFY